MLRLLLTAGLSIVALAMLISCGTAPPWTVRPAPDPPPAASSASGGPVSGAAPPAEASSRSTARGSVAGAASAPPASAPSGPLGAEQRWLADLFEGTPVQVVRERDGAVRLEVPLRYAFDHGSAQPKAALRAVLDRLGQSLKRQPAARLAQWAPGTEGDARRQAMRAHLIGLGLPAHRVSAVAPPSMSYTVSLRLALPPAPIQRVGNAEPPATFRPPAAG